MIFYYLRTINFTIMKKILFLIMALIASSPLATAKDKTVELCILETSDVHGSFFPYDFINRTPCKGSLARLSTYVKRERERLTTATFYRDSLPYTTTISSTRLHPM